MDSETSDRYDTRERSDTPSNMTTKELCEETGVSEAALRRWLKEGERIPELADVKRDWRGWRQWEDRHVAAIRRYQRSKQMLHAETSTQLNLPLKQGTR